MSLLGLIALVSGIAGVILTIYQKIWCWPAALISVVASIIEFYDERLYGDMLLNVFYFFSGVYGWYYWNKKSKEEFVAIYTPRNTIPSLTIITALLAVLLYFLLKFFKSDQIIFDAILTAVSLSATYMMVKKWIENWIIWVIADTAYIFLYLRKDMLLFAILYGVFAIIAMYGFLKWKKKLTTSS